MRVKKLNIKWGKDRGKDAIDPNTVVFRYPCAFGDASILREIRIESGVLAVWTSKQQ